MGPTISSNSSKVGSEEISLCLYVHSSNLLVLKGPSSVGFSSLIILFKAATVMSACTSKSVRSPELSRPSWSTRRYQIVFSSGVSACFSACFPLADPLGAMIRVASGGVKRDELIIKDHMTISRDVSSRTQPQTTLSPDFFPVGMRIP